ncbi:hypothetical protein NDU88_005268 [Pleurodeles waltl]|uniref:Uncharacterized protein n=1 Tax=Pleurodeles waltl TaxID=8319 RepID=A0AAV7M9X2_PLEWA|nr:hypothetical protein NDU88_005268 [Pleurodeles waltl]
MTPGRTGADEDKGKKKGAEEKETTDCCQCATRAERGLTATEAAVAHRRGRALVEAPGWAARPSGGAGARPCGWNVRDRKGSKIIRMGRGQELTRTLFQLRPRTHMCYRMELDWTSASVGTGCAAQFNVALITKMEAGELFRKSLIHHKRLDIQDRSMAEGQNTNTEKNDKGFLFRVLTGEGNDTYMTDVFSKNID